ncbi:gastrotropin-like [Argonauta hians]
MEQFLGRWVEIKNGQETQQEFMDKMGIPKETAEIISKSTGFMDTVKEGDLFKVTTGYLEDPSLNKVYSFKLNEAFTDNDNFGQKFTFLSRVEGNKWYDSITNYYNQTSIESVREVVSDTLIVTSTCDGKSLISKFKRE